MLIVHTLTKEMNRTMGSRAAASGRYGSTNDIVRSALRLLERQENQLVALRQMIEAGEQSGESNLSLHDIAAQVKQQQGPTGSDPNALYTAKCIRV